MSNKIKAKAREFLHENRLREVTLDSLRRIITSQGYTIVEFNHIYNDEPVAALITALKLDDMVAREKGFTYADQHRRLVFLHEDLSNREKLLVLAHEEGHIYCDHLSTSPIIGKDVLEEHEANEFTHYILHRSLSDKISGFIKAHQVLCAVAAIALVAGVIGVLMLQGLQKESSYYGEYYITSSGNRYHTEECKYVKDKSTAHRMTTEEFKSGDYEPCGICLPSDK